LKSLLDAEQEHFLLDLLPELAPPGLFFCCFFVLNRASEILIGNGGHRLHSAFVSHSACGSRKRHQAAALWECGCRNWYLSANGHEESVSSSVACCVRSPWIPEFRALELQGFGLPLKKLFGEKLSGHAGIDILTRCGCSLFSKDKILSRLPRP